MPDFKSLSELEKYLNSKIQSALKNEVAETTIQTMQKHIESDVYAVYEPKQYVRKGYQGGLSDPHNIEVEVIDDNTISVENIRFDGDREVAQIVESGKGYQYKFDYYGVPRPFTENTREELKNTDQLKKSMKQGLKRQGIDSI